jgi:hypothetical protein
MSPFEQTVSVPDKKKPEVIGLVDVDSSNRLDSLEMAPIPSDVILDLHRSWPDRVSGRRPLGLIAANATV